MKASQPIPYTGDEKLREPVTRALHRVVDPEVALDIVEMGLVYGVDVGEGAVRVRVTMTSAACPVTELIVATIEEELRAELGHYWHVEVDVVWSPPWDPRLMSARARFAMGWD